MVDSIRKRVKGLTFVVSIRRIHQWKCMFQSISFEVLLAQILFSDKSVRYCDALVAESPDGRYAIESGSNLSRTILTLERLSRFAKFGVWSFQS